MKKLSIFILTALLALSLTACRRNNSKATTPTMPLTTPTSMPTVPATTENKPSENTMPQATGNIGDGQDGIIGNQPNETQDNMTGNSTDSTIDSTTETEARNRTRNPGTTGGTF